MYEINKAISNWKSLKAALSELTDSYSDSIRSIGLKNNEFVVDRASDLRVIDSFYLGPGADVLPVYSLIVLANNEQEQLVRYVNQTKKDFGAQYMSISKPANQNQDAEAQKALNELRLRIFDYEGCPVKIRLATRLLGLISPAENGQILSFGISLCKNPSVERLTHQEVYQLAKVHADTFPLEDAVRIFIDELHQKYHQVKFFYVVEGINNLHQYYNFQEYRTDDSGEQSRVPRKIKSSNPVFINQSSLPEPSTYLKRSVDGLVEAAERKTRHNKKWSTCVFPRLNLYI